MAQCLTRITARWGGPGGMPPVNMRVREMTYSNVQFGFAAPGWRHRLDMFFATLGQGVNAASLSRARLRQVAALEGLSDQELARRGLTRDEIAAHVFADLFPRT
ncbi:hypothetical protein ACS3SW_19895 [Roseobacteraceae bacterium S113]